MEFVQALYIAIYISLLTVPFFIAYKFRKRIRSFTGICLVVGLSSTLMSSVVIMLWLGNDWYLDVKIAQLDRNGDGFWSDSETKTWSPDEQKLMDSYIGDGGRNVFAAIIFPFLSVAYSILVALLFWSVATLRLRYKNA
jgi:hypothetical protein